MFFCDWNIHKEINLAYLSVLDLLLSEESFLDEFFAKTFLARSLEFGLRTPPLRAPEPPPPPPPLCWRRLLKFRLLAPERLPI